MAVDWTLYALHVHLIYLSELRSYGKALLQQIQDSQVLNFLNSRSQVICKQIFALLLLSCGRVAKMVIRSKAGERSRKQRWLLDRPWFGMPSCVARFRHFKTYPKRDDFDVEAESPVDLQLLGWTFPVGTGNSLCSVSQCLDANGNAYVTSAGPETVFPWLCQSDLIHSSMAFLKIECMIM